jgi:hypothetical protein
MALFLPAPRQWPARVFGLRAHSQFLGLPVCQYRTHDGRNWTLRAGGSPLVATIHYKGGAGQATRGLSAVVWWFCRVLAVRCAVTEARSAGGEASGRRSGGKQ